MRLAKIKLAGFKSFVDPTTLPLPSNLVGIVGPNGCGKSNVIDAVRWVMGESSAKHLRGDSMADVIFNGSTTRKPVGQAHIELVFDNSQGKLGGQWAHYAEISVKRQVGRDGQSNYYLNGARCRRKDITDIFLGTGLGPRSYAIIEQGMISRLIEAKPDDLRIFIEEAAGISKYKERRRETETRMQNTRENINRINDLREELGKRLEVLQRQARSAEKYKELKQQERLVKAQLHALRWQAMQREAGECERSLAAQENALEAKIAELRHIEAQIEVRRLGQVDANEQFNRVQGEFYAVGADIARLEQAVRHAKATQLQQEKELTETDAAWRDAQTHQQSDTARIEQSSADLDMDEARLLEAAQNASASQQRLSKCEDAMQQWQHQWDGFNQRAAEQLRSAEVERARIEHLEGQLLQLGERQRKLRAELDTLQAQALDEDVARLDEEAQQAQQRSEHLVQQLDAVHSTVHQLRQQVAELTQLSRHTRDELQHARERLASLEALRAQSLGQNDSSVKAWLDQTGFAALPRLLDGLTVEPGWEHAVEVALGARLRALCADDLNKAASTLSELRQGRVDMIEQRGVDVTPINAALDLPLLTSKVRSNWPVAALLDGVYAADDANAPWSLRSHLAARESIFTQDGTCWGANWVSAQRLTEGKDTLLLQEQKRLEALQAVDQLTAQLEQLEQAIAEANALQQAADAERDQMQSQRAEAAKVLAGAQAQLQAKRLQVEQQRQRQERLLAEWQEAALRDEQTSHDVRQARGRLELALAATEHHDQERESLLTQRDTFRVQLEDVRKVARVEREAAHEIALRCQTLRAQLQGTRQNLARIEQQLAVFARRRDDLTAALLNADEPILRMGQELAQQLSKRLEVEAALTAARQALEEVEHHWRELNQARHSAEADAQTLRSNLDQQRLAWQELRIRSQTFLEQVTELGFEMQPLLDQMPTDANEAQWQQELDHTAKSIQRLGAINLAAIDEFTEQSERKQYLDAQYEDLAQALSTLENAIRKIDHETKSRFQDTFDQVNAGLQAKFPRLFGGGHAYLELTGDDLLSTGVTVMARPPGKRNSTIHLLSGGEKALTAVALVFSIFDLNPAPFCMLDEVDAPLDDANVGRFCTLVKEMSERVQFIFITHNKVTMELAEQLNGVTMHEAGVSRLVAVDVDAAVQLAKTA